MSPKEMLYGLLTYLYGSKNIDLDFNKIEIKFNKNNRLKYVYYNGRPIFTFRNNDGYLLPLIEAVRYIRLPYVVVDEETAKHAIKGKSVPAKFIVRASPDLRPNAEVAVLDIKGNPVAVGRAIYSIRELSLGKGYAVKPRDTAELDDPSTDATA